MIGIPLVPESRFVEMTPEMLRERLAQWTDGMAVVVPVALARRLVADLDHARAQHLRVMHAAVGVNEAMKAWGGGLLAVAGAVGVDVFAPPATPEAITAATLAALRQLADRTAAAEADAEAARHILTAWGLR